MKNKILIATLLIMWAVQSTAEDQFARYIDPTIGNVSRLLVPTYPTFHLPNQMLRMIPSKADYLSDQVSGFPLLVASHRSAGIMHMKVSVGEPTEDTWNRKMNIDQDLEINRPWHYSTYLVDDEITVSFVPGGKTAIYRVDFPASEGKNVLIAGKGELDNNVRAPGTFTLEEIITYRPRHVETISRQLSAFAFVEITDLKGKPLKGVILESADGRIAIRLDDAAAVSILIKYGMSYISAEQARENYEIELRDTTFADLLHAGRARWEETVGKIRVKGGTTAQKRTFYTALYRTHERMVNINEGGRYYSGYDGKVHNSERPFYVDDWVWDSFRAQHPLYALLNPEIENDFLNSYVLMYEQSGWMPTFPQVYGNRLGMNAFHSSAIFVDGYRKGLRDYGVQSAIEGILKNLSEATLIPWRQGFPKRPIDEFYHENAYFPALAPGEDETEPLVDKVEKRQAVAVTLGASYDAWALSELAKELGNDELHEAYSQISKNYKNLWHPEMQFFMPKDAEGNWIEIDPKWDGGIAFRDYFDENNGWTYAWDVQHDIDGLIELLGGRQQAEARLDQLFREPLNMRKREFFVRGSNSTGLVGQFAMGNEPSFHIPYLYNYFGAPWKTQKLTRFLLDTWFNDTVHGIPGDEDGGGMSAFVVFTAMGFYPVTPGIPEYAITSPIFEEVAIALDNGRVFRVVATGSSKRNKYIQKAFLNEVELKRPFISHDQIVNGGTLELVLAEKPNKEWGNQ
jgi:predicted alpha-1,2-mannosidase